MYRLLHENSMTIEQFNQQAAQAPETYLSDVGLAYRSPEEYYIQDFVSPVLEVQGSEFAYRTWNTVAQRLLQSNVQSRGGARSGINGGSNVVPWAYTKVTGETLPKINHADIDPNDVNTFGRSAIEEDAAIAVRGQMLLQRESRIVDLFHATANYASASHYRTLATTAQWSAFNTSTPESDIKTGISQILKTSGFLPNTIILPWEVAQQLSMHPDVKVAHENDAKGSNSDTFGGGDLMGLPPVLWGLKVIVPKVSYVTSNSGQTETNGFLWGKNVVIAYISAAPSILRPSFSYTFGLVPFSVFRGSYARPEGGEFIVAKEDNVEKILASRAGYLIKDAVA